jgi:hypothetical protein
MVRAELAQIPQHGMVLGSPSARVTVFEYGDLICGPCARTAGSVLAPVIASFVRSDAVRIQFEPIVESPRSEAFAIGAYAAGAQRAAWDYILLAYLCTTPSSDGPLYEAPTLARVLGINRSRWHRQLAERRWPAQIEQSARVALLGGFSNYPVFIIRGPGIRRSKSTGGRSVIILQAPVTLAALTQAIITAEPSSG